MKPAETLARLVTLSHTLGRPDWDCVLLGEGNTSARVDEESFYVKASGAQLGSAGPEGFVRVAFAPVLELLASDQGGDDDVTAVLTAAALEPPGFRPSVETMMHAYLLSCRLTAGEQGINFVGHTHPTALNVL